MTAITPASYAGTPWARLADVGGLRDQSKERLHGRLG